jgi:hypothetical protein
MNMLRWRVMCRRVRSCLTQPRLANLFYISVLKRKQQTLKLILLIMTINILISITILRQQTKMTIIFKAYCQSVKYEPDLLYVLNAYRLSNSKLNRYRIISEQLPPSRPNPPLPRNQITTTSGEDHDFDHVFSRSTFTEIKFNRPPHNNKNVNVVTNTNKNNNNNNNNNNKPPFYEPTFLINNERACESRAADSDGPIFMVFLIHSHKNNYLRRKAMRDTWLSLRHVYLDEVLATATSDTGGSRAPRRKLELAHLFVVGSNDDDNNNGSSSDFIQTEASTHNDILMIDTYDNYRNLVYKHLAIVNWMSQFCQNTTYVVKLDDDVYVNLKPLIRHLYFKFGLEFPVNYKFIYCNVQEMARPIRQNESKWFVNTESYPFEFYPVRFFFSLIKVKINFFLFF